MVAGIWFLLRGGAFWIPDVWISDVWFPLPYPANSPSTTMLLAVLSTGCGLLLLMTALLIVASGKSAWMLLALSAFAATLLGALAWWQSGVVDWSGMTAAFVLCLVAALPNVREAMLVPTGNKDG